MECARFQDELHAVLTGRAAADLAREVRGHGNACPACAAETRGIEAVLGLLRRLPEEAPAPRVWEGVRRGLAPRAASGALAFWIRTAAAASLLVAAFSFALLFVRAPAEARPVVVETSRALAWNEVLSVQDIATVKVPDVGTLKAGPGTALRFPDARRAVLEQGEVFAEILPSGRGFEVRAPEARARVHGTRFGVRAPSTVYVLEGRVEVETPAWKGELGPRQGVVGPRLVEVSAEDHLRWLLERERPGVRLTLDPGEAAVVTPGAPLRWRLILETDALAPLRLAPLSDPSQFVSLRIDGALVPLEPGRLSLREAAPGPNGGVRLDVSHRCVIECAVDPALFREKGTARVRAFFSSGAQAPEGFWVGLVASNEILVEVR
jgi:ferric-dicitrate binding protein FerR (iron transport regulator)